MAGPGRASAGAQLVQAAASVAQLRRADPMCFYGPSRPVPILCARVPRLAVPQCRALRQDFLTLYVAQLRRGPDARITHSRSRLSPACGITSGLAVFGEPGGRRSQSRAASRPLAPRRSDNGRLKVGRVRLGERGVHVDEVVIVNPHFLPGQPPTLTVHQHRPTLRDQMLADAAGPILRQRKGCGCGGLNTEKKHPRPMVVGRGQR